MQSFVSGLIPNAGLQGLSSHPDTKMILQSPPTLSTSSGNLSLESVLGTGWGMLVEEPAGLSAGARWLVDVACSALDSRSQ